MKVSVVIPTRNRAKIVSKCIEHILNQDYHQYEVIVIDDGSEDNTLESLKGFSSYKNLKFIPLSERKGPAFCRNLGVKESQGELIIFIDSDIFVLPNFINSHVKVHKSHPEGVVAVGPVIAISEIDKKLVSKGSILDFSNAYFASGNASIPREIFMKIGGFDEIFNVYGWEDIDFGLKLKKFGINSIKVPDAIGYHYQPLPNENNLKALIEKEKERAKSAVYLYKKYPTFEVRLMIQNTLFHRILNQLLTGLGYIDEKRLVKILNSNKSFNYKRFFLTVFLTKIYLKALKEEIKNL
ncbi:MAG: glycosyltransferase family 2 protein [bacterium]|nr:glycosyltransferase family 2 protein [bacterium]